MDDEATAMQYRCEELTLSAETAPFFENMSNPSIFESVKKITFLEGMDAIENYNLAKFPYLEEIVIPSSVTTIGDSAFADCYTLSTITLPDSLTSLGFEVFYRCSNLSSIYCQASRKPDNWNTQWCGNVSVQIIRGSTGPQ